MENNNKKGRPSISESARRNKPLIIRLNDKERETIKAKCEEAGYQAAGAFVRDLLIKGKPGQKQRIPLSHLQLSLELQRIARLIQKGNDSEHVVRELFALNNKLLTGE